MISVNLTGQDNAEVKAGVCGENRTDHAPFLTFDIGPLGVILASADQARALAGALHRAADKLDGLPKWTPPPVPESAHDEVGF